MAGHGIVKTRLTQFTYNADYGPIAIIVHVRHISSLKSYWLGMQYPVSDVGCIKRARQATAPSRTRYTYSYHERV